MLKRIGGFLINPESVVGVYPASHDVSFDETSKGFIVELTNGTTLMIVWVDSNEKVPATLENIEMILNWRGANS